MTQLAVLTCDGCGELLAIGEADWLACPGCGKRVVVPEPYRDLRDVDRDAAVTRGQIEAFYRRLATRSRLVPWLVRRAGKERALAWLVAFYMACAVALFVVPIVIVFTTWWIF